MKQQQDEGGGVLGPEQGKVRRSKSLDKDKEQQNSQDFKSTSELGGARAKTQSVIPGESQDPLT